MAEKMTMPDEGLAAVQDFINNPTDDIKERAEQGAKMITLLNGRLKSIDGERGMTWFTYGGVIHRLKMKETWRQFEGMESEGIQFGSFAEKYLGFGLAKANTLESIWLKAPEKGLGAKEIQEIGWNAARQMLRVVENTEDVKEWLDRYRGCTNRDEFNLMVSDAIRQKKQSRSDSSPSGDASSPSARLVEDLPKRVIFNTKKAESDFLTESLEMVAKRVGKELGVSMSSTEALLLIIADWRNGKKNHE